MSERIRAPHCNPGVMSGRSFTRKEVAAARRVGLVYGSTKKGTLGGPLFWATGQVRLDEARQNAADWTLVAAALEREWDTWRDAAWDERRQAAAELTRMRDEEGL